MPTYEVTSPSGKKLRVTGSAPPSKEQLDEIFSQYEVQQPVQKDGEVSLSMNEPIPQRPQQVEPSFADKAKGVAETVGAIGTGMTFGAAGGAIGALEGVFEAVKQGKLGTSEAQQIIESQMMQRMQQGTYQPRTESGQDYVAAIGEIVGALPPSPLIPETAMMGARVPKLAADKLDLIAADRATTAKAMKESAMSPLDIQKPQPSITSSAIKTLSEKEIRDVADVDPEFFKALEDIGVTADPLTSYASQNPQFRGIEQGLTAMPGSSLAPAEEAFRKDLSAKAAGVFKQYGALETGEASVKWRDNAMNTIRELEDEADAVYGSLGAKINKRQPAQPTNTVELIETETVDLPIGILDSSAPAVLKQIYAEIQPRKRTNQETGEIETIPANYASLDATRRKIGAAAFKNEGDFKDAEKGLLKRVYGALSEDLNAMAESQGLVEEVKQARAVVAKRKVIESQVEDLIGKKLQKDIEPVVAGAVKSLMKGGMQKYKNIMSNISDPIVRQELVMTSLNNIFSGTRGGNAGDFKTAQYLDWYNSTMKKEALRKVISADLPEGAEQKLDALAKIAEGVTRAKADKVRTGAINALLDDKAGMVRRMVGGAVQQTVGRIPLPVGELASSIGSIIKADVKRSASAGELLASPEFANVIRRGVAEGVITGNKASAGLKKAEAELMKSEKYKAWADTLSKDELETIAAVGLTAFLISQQEEDK